MSNYKPQLLPNNKAGVDPNWEERIVDPKEWLLSFKLDGGRVAIKSDGDLVGRSLKGLPSVHMNWMAREIALLLQKRDNIIIEGEFYSHDMNFSEIMHFFKTEDVTSTKTVEKYKKLWMKTGGKKDNGWKYPGRDVEWLTTWHDSLKFHAFDLVDTDYPNTPKAIRTISLEESCKEYNIKVGDMSPDLVFIKQRVVYSLTEMYEMYNEAIDLGYEGIVAMHKSAHYKFGRYTLNSKKAFKIKNDNVEFDGLIIAVEESTVAIEGAPKSTNELGRSVTSKLKEHRQPSGMAKGFLVQMEDGRELTVSLKGFDHPARIKMLQEPLAWIGETIRFTGMHPVKVGGVPRSAHYTAGNIREAVW
jgi:ATP-dependent DNA ligase